MEEKLNHVFLSFYFLDFYLSYFNTEKFQRFYKIEEK